MVPGHRHSVGLFGAIAHALVMGGMVLTCYGIGCFLEFREHPMAWIGENWLPTGLILWGLVGVARRNHGRR